MTRTERLVDALRLIDTMTVDELRDLGHAMKNRMAELNDDARGEFKVGDKVTFDAKKRGVITGVVTSRVGKSMRVRQESTTKPWERTRNGMEWRVSPTLLRRA